MLDAKHDLSTHLLLVKSQLPIGGFHQGIIISLVHLHRLSVETHADGVALTVAVKLKQTCNGCQGYDR